MVAAEPTVWPPAPWRADPLGRPNPWLAPKLLVALQLALVAGWIVSARLAGPGLDTDNYVYLFKAPPGLTDGIKRFEPFFLMLVYGLRSLLRSPEGIFFAIAAIAVLIKLIAVARLPDTSLLLFAAGYAATCLPLYEYNQVRVAVALGFIYFAWNALASSPARSAVFFAIALGFHYSSALLIVPAALVIAARSRLAMSLGGVVLCMIGAAAFVIDAPQMLQSYASGLILRAAEIEGAEINPLSFNVLLMMASTAAFVFSRFELKAYVLLVCGIGLALFAVLVRLEVPYAYRVLETFAAVLPYAWARAFRGSLLQRGAMLALVMAAVAYSPVHWGRLG